MAAAVVLILGGLWRASENGNENNLPAILGSPIAAPMATPDPATLIGTLVDTMLPGSVPGPQYVNIESSLFPADDSTAMNTILKSNFVILVLKGQITVTVTTPSKLRKGLAATETQSVAARTAQILTAGDSIAVGPDAVLRIIHNGNVPALVLSLDVFDPNIGNPFGTDTTDQQLVNGTGHFSMSPLHVILNRESLAPRQSIPAPAPGTMQLVVPETLMTPSKLQTSTNGSATNIDTKPMVVLVLTISQPTGAGTATPAP